MSIPEIAREFHHSRYKACELTDWKNDNCLENLAAADAERCDFQQAVEWQEKAVELTPPAWRGAYEARLKLYREGKPYRELPKTAAAASTSPAEWWHRPRIHGVPTIVGMVSSVMFEEDRTGCEGVLRIRQSNAAIQRAIDSKFLTRPPWPGGAALAEHARFYGFPAKVRSAPLHAPGD